MPANTTPAGDFAPGYAWTTRARTITEADVVAFSGLTGDFHPQHTDAVWAEESRFGERIAHGMLVLSYSVGLAGFDPDRIVALRGIDGLTFKRPTRIGDTIHVAAKVEERKPLDEEHSLARLAWRVLNQEDALVLRAKIEVLWRNQAPAAEAAA